MYSIILGLLSFWNKAASVDQVELVSVSPLHTHGRVRDLGGSNGFRRCYPPSMEIIFDNSDCGSDSACRDTIAGRFPALIKSLSVLCFLASVYLISGSLASLVV